jgi:UrcA family protein
MNYTRAIAMCAAALAAAIALGAAAYPVHARAPDAVVVVAPADVVVRHISYADLNLASAAGEKTLNDRVGNAVTDLCLEAVGGFDGSLTQKLSSRACERSAWNEARPQVTQAVLRAGNIASVGVSAIPLTAITIKIAQ